MFSQASVILFTGVSASMHAGIHPPGQTPTPGRHPAPGRHPPGQTPPPAGKTATAADGTHSTGMHSYF